MDLRQATGHRGALLMTPIRMSHGHHRARGRLDRAERALCRALLDVDIEGRDALRALLADVWREMRQREET